MKFKYTLIASICSIFLLTACENKVEINESLVANSKNNEPYRENFIKEKFSLKTTDNENIKFESTPIGLSFEKYKGKKVVLVDVFATWCESCIETIPMLKGLKEKYKDDLEIVSVLYNDEKSKKEMEDFIKKYKITYPVAIGKDNLKLTNELGVEDAPELYLFAKDGSFVNKFIGPNPKEIFEEYINFALKEI